MSSGVFNRGAYILLADAGVSWDGSTDVRVLLVTSTWTPDPDLNFVSQLTNELSGGNYVRKATASRTLTEDDANNQVVLDAADITWTALGAAAGTPAYAIAYKYNASDAAAELIAWDALTSPPIPNGGDYTVQWNAEGLVKLTT